VDFSTIDFEKILFPEMTGWLLAAKIFFIMFNLGVAAFIIYVWVATIYLRRLWVIDFIEFFTFRAYGTRVVDKDWNEIKRMMLGQTAAGMRRALVEARNLVDDVLLRLSFEGKDLGEKLEKPRAEIFSDLDAMKEADFVCQKIIGDRQYAPDYQEAKKVILIFEQGLKDVAAFRDK
jgi:hypothetical protein